MPYELLAPNANGDKSQLLLSGAPTHWEALATVGDGYVYRTISTSYITDLVNIPSVATLYTVNSVLLYGRDRVSGWYADTKQPKLILKTYGVEYPYTQAIWGFGQQGDTGWVTTYARADVNPSTLAAWSFQEITDLQVGVSLAAGYGFQQDLTEYCDQLALIVVEFPSCVVGTLPVIDIITTTATAKGTIVDFIPAVNESAVTTQYGHCWNTTGNPTISDSKTTKGVPAATGNFSSSLTGLTVGQRYYVRSYITDIFGTVYGTQVTFVAGFNTHMAGLLPGILEII